MKKKKLTDEEKVQASEMLHRRLIHQEATNFFMLFIVSEVMADQQMQHVLGALADRLISLGFKASMVEAELDLFADTVQKIRAAKLDNANKGACANA